MPPGLAVPEELSWFALLLPGFVLVSVMGVVTERRDWSELEFVAYSLIGSMLCLVLTLPFYLLARFAIRLSFRRLAWPAGPALYSLLAVFVLANFVLAAFLGVRVGMALEDDASIKTVNAALGLRLEKHSWMRPMKYILLHNNSGRLQSLAVDGRAPALKQPRAYVRIAFKDGPSYEGWPYLLPHGNSKTELLLSPACRQGEKDRPFVLVRGPGVLLPAEGYLSIELIDREGSGCFAQVKEQASCAACSACRHAVAQADASQGQGEETEAKAWKAVRSACSSCADEADGYAISQLLPEALRGRASDAARTCRAYVECGAGADHAGCQAKAACLSAAAVLASGAPACQGSGAAFSEAAPAALSAISPAPGTPSSAAVPPPPRP